MDFSDGDCTGEPTEGTDMEEVISTVKTLLIHSIALNNSEGFNMALDGLEQLRVGLNWSSPPESTTPVCNDWNTPLTLSAKLGRTGMVATLLEKGANPNLFSKYKNGKPIGRTALHKASKSGHLQVVDCLLKHGCDINITDTKGWMPIHDAICRDKVDCAFILLENGANPRTSFSIPTPDTENVDDIGTASLMFCTRTYNSDLFIFPSVELNCLSLSANCHQPKIVSRLLQRYFLNDVNCQSPLGRTALHEAVILPKSLNLSEEINVQNRYETLKILLDCGVDPNIPDRMRKTALHIFFDQANRYKVIVKKYPQIVSKTILLLRDYGANINMADLSGRTAAHQAAAFGDLETMQLLLELGASVTSLDNDSKTPAHVAAYHRNFDVLQLLLNRASHAEFVNCHGDTVLHTVIMATTHEDVLLTVAEAFKSEFDKFQKNVYGETVHDLAAKFKLKRLSCLLASQSAEAADANSTCTPVPRRMEKEETGNNCVRDSTNPREILGVVHESGRDSISDLSSHSDSVGYSDNTEVPDLCIEEDTDVNEYLLKLSHEYRIRTFHMDGDGKCHERCNVALQSLTFVEKLLELVANDDHSFDYQILRTGSAFEGYRIGKPDEFDYMCELKSLADDKCEIVETEQPGFVRIQVKEEYRQEWTMFVSKEGFLDAMKVKCFLAKRLYEMSSTPSLVHKTRLSFNTTSYDSCGLCHPFISISKAGVKMTLFWRGIVYQLMPIDIDITPAIHFSSWPNSAKTPPCHVLKGCADLGYHVVPKSEGGDSLLWRFSFSVAELKILQNTSPVQAACYTALKIIKGQTELRRSSKRFSHLGFLHTYVLKTRFFEELERSNDSKLWQEDKLTERVCSVLESTAGLLTQKESSLIESYFLPGHRVISNADTLFGKLVAASIKTTLRNVVRLLQKEPIMSSEDVEEGAFSMKFESDST